MLILAGSGETLALVAAQMTVTGIIGTALYRQLKGRLARERPYVAHPGIELGTAPLDRYSFPSGHTLHAVSFTILATAAVPELAPILVPFTLLVAASRVVLGLHYPSDVLAGALLGALLAGTSLAVRSV
jgi:undecaprenyl-diphosphatase